MAVRKGTGAERAGTHAVLASRRRVQLLDALRASPTPMAIAELAALCELHVTTVRFHLDALTGAGLVSAEPERNPARGRPRQLYRALAPLEPGHADSGYQQLARVLAAHWASPEDDPVGRAEAAGRAWALDYLTDTPGSPRSIEDAASTLTTLFAEMGFDPKLESTPGGNANPVACLPVRIGRPAEPERRVRTASRTDARRPRPARRTGNR